MFGLTDVDQRVGRKSNGTGAGARSSGHGEAAIKAWYLTPMTIATISVEAQ